MSLLEKTALALQEGDRAIPIIFDRLDLNLSSSHVERLCSSSWRNVSRFHAGKLNGRDQGGMEMPETLVVEQGGIGTGSRRSSQRKGVDSLTQCYGQVKLSQVEAVVVVIVSENKE